MMDKKIIFSKPDYRELAKQGYRFADMHIHSTYSDGAASVDEILSKSREFGFGVAITDHNEIKGSLEAFSKKRKGDFIIPGIEVKSKEYIDILFYFYDTEEMESFYSKEILPNKKPFLHTSKVMLSIDELHQMSKKYRCVCSIPHLFGYSIRGGMVDPIKTYKAEIGNFEIFEAINGGNNRDKNLKAVDYIKKESKGITGGTDSHTLESIGNILTCVKAEDEKDFLEGIRHKKAAVIGIENKIGKLNELSRVAISRIKNILLK
jgi:predicted metal-dependent phosphoesterase TrpH